MRTAALVLAAALAAVAATATHAPAAHAAAAMTPQAFADPAGDNGTAPDVTNISVGNDLSGGYEFEIAFGTDYGPNAQFLLYLDTDKNSSTGNTDQDGAEYRVFDDHATHEFEVDSWNGSDWMMSSDTTASVTVGATLRSLEIVINKSDLGGATSFNFFVVALDGTSQADTGYYDDAPSGSGTFSYALQQAPLKLSVAGTNVVLQRSAHRLTVAVAVKRSDTNAFVGGDDGTVACTATAGGKKLHVVLGAFVSAGGGKGSAAVCQFALPTKHLPVVARVKVAADGVSITKTVTRRS